MFKKSDSVLASTSKPRTNPFTPMRRFFFKLELLKPIVALGKRVRDQSHVADISEQGSSTTKTPTLIKDQVHHQQTRQGTARIALQQHDQPLDAIVITTLPSYPFCCHEDLLMMSRSQLVEVAMVLNSRLPACSQIKLADGIPDAHIRHSIETLVGIVPDMPGAPKPIKSRPFGWMDNRDKIDLLVDPEQDAIPSPPTSPLSMRISRRQEKSLPIMMSPPHLLERLEEEDENDFFTMKRPLKKRKVSSISTVNILDEDIDMEEEKTPTKARDLRLSMNMESPTLFMNMSLASSHMMLRSHSQRDIHGIEQSSPSPCPSSIFSPDDIFKVDSAFVNSKPRYRSIGKNTGRKSGRKAGSSTSQPGSSRKKAKTKKRDSQEKQAGIITRTRTLNYRPFELPTSNSGGQYYTHTTTKPLSSTGSTKSSSSSYEKARTITATSFELEDGDYDNTWFNKNTKTNHHSGISTIENEDSQGWN